MARPHTAELGRVEGSDTYRDVSRNNDAHRLAGLLIHRIDDELFFANSAFFVRDVKDRLTTAEPPAHSLIIDAEGISDIDATATMALSELLEDLHAAEVDISFARLRQPVRDMFERSGLLDRIGADNIYLEVDDAVAAFELRSD